jgi:LysM repeat protein
MNMIDCASVITQQTATTLIQNGITHVGRYLSSGWKGLTIPESQVMKQAGLNIVSIYETNPTQASYFSHDQGVFDANAAYQLAQTLGQPEGTAIYFTVDYDAQTKEFANILNYFQGLKDTLKSYKVGAYGKFELILLLQTKGLADYFFQTYAWSSGQHAKNLHLFQYKNDINQYGLNLDLDQVENADCGSWGGQAVQPAAQPAPAPTTAPEPAPAPAPVPATYKIVSGDTLSAIAQKFNTTVQHLQTLNGITDANKIYIGQLLKLTGTPSPSLTTYKIQSGDNLTTLAKRYKTTVDYLMHINPKISNPNKIYIGQVINIPKI